MAQPDAARLKQLLADARSRRRFSGGRPPHTAGAAALQSAKCGHEQPLTAAGSKQVASRPRSAGRASKLAAPTPLQGNHEQPTVANATRAAASSPPPARPRITTRAPPANGSTTAGCRRPAPLHAGAAAEVSAVAPRRWNNGTTRAAPQPASAASAACITAGAMPDALQYATHGEAVAQVDAADWQVLELLQAAAEAGGPWEGVRQRGRAPPSGQARAWQQQQQQQQQQQVHSRRHGSLHSSGYGRPQRQRPQQPVSPLARQLAALRQSMGQAAGDGAGSGGSGAATERAGVPGPASSLESSGLKLTSAVSLLVPQELLVEAAREAAAEDAAAARRRSSRGTAEAAGAEAAAARRAAEAHSSCLGALEVEPPPPCTDSGQQPASQSAQPAGAATSSGHAADGAQGTRVPDGAAGEAQLEAAAAAADVQVAAAAELQAAAAAAQLEAAAAELRVHCWQGRYEEARRVLREAGEQCGSESLLAAADAAGRTPLMLACCGGHGKLVKLLLRKGASMEARDVQGNTALLLAVMRSQRAVARHLIQCGADASRRNAAGACGADLIAAWAAQQQGGDGGADGDSGNGGGATRDSGNGGGGAGDSG